jgi:hypothetical protein
MSLMVLGDKQKNKEKNKQKGSGSQCFPNRRGQGRNVFRERMLRCGSLKPHDRVSSDDFRRHAIHALSSRAFRCTSSSGGAIVRPVSSPRRTTAFICTGNLVRALSRRVDQGTPNISSLRSQRAGRALRGRVRESGLWSGASGRACAAPLSRSRACGEQTRISRSPSRAGRCRRQPLGR